MDKTKIFAGVLAVSLTTAALYAAPGVTPGKAPVTKANALAKADTMFARMDANKDGKLDVADREAKAKKHFAKLDGDKNGAVSEAEFLTAHRERADKVAAWRDGPKADGGERGMRHKGGKHRGGRGGMAKADANGDNVVTQAEFRAAAEARFAKADTNSDGTISADERKAQKGKGKRGPRAPMPPAEG